MLMIELGFIPPSEYNKIVNDQKEKEMKEKEERRKRKEERKKKEEEMEGKRTKQIENSTEQGPLSKQDEELLSSSSLSTTRSKELCSLSNQTKNESLKSKNEYRFLEDSVLNPTCSIPSTARSIYQPNSTFSYERVFFPVPKSFIFSSTVFFFYGSSEWKLKNIQKIIEKGGFWYFTSFLIIKY